MASPDTFHNFRRDIADEARVIRFPAAGLPPGIEELLMIGYVDHLFHVNSMELNKREKTEEISPQNVGSGTG